MKAEELPISTTVIVIIAIVVVAVLIVFSIAVSAKGKEQAKEFTNMSSESVNQGLNPVEKVLFHTRCDLRCSKAKELAYKISSNEDCSRQVAASNFCEETINYSGKNIFCDEFYKREGANPCTLTFNDKSSRELGCTSLAEEKC